MLATVTCGLFVSWNGPRFISPATRLQGYFVWDLVVYLVESIVFLLTGLQARVVADTLDLTEWERLAAACAAVCAAIIAVRFIWVYLATYLPRWLFPRMAGKDPAPPGKNTFIIAFTGIRGVVSLAAALSIPIDANGVAFPDRGLVLLATFAVILATLVGQGLTLPWVISCLGIAEYGKKEADLDKRREIAARLASIDAALARLDTLEGAVSAPETVSALQTPQRGPARLFRRRLPRRGAWRSFQCGGGIAAAIPGCGAQSIADLYYRGEINDEARRRIERELDLEDSRIRHAAESGAARAL